MESNVEITVCNKAERAGWLVRKVKWPGRRGAPDRLFLKRGRFVLIEFKDTGLPMQELQKNEKRRFEAAGAEVHRIDSVRDGLRVLGIEA